LLAILAGCSNRRQQEVIENLRTSRRRTYHKKIEIGEGICSWISHCRKRALGFSRGDAPFPTEITPMSSRTWIDKVFGLTIRKSGPARRIRPTLEILEGRLAPASFVVSSVGDLATDPTTLRYALANLTAGAAASTNSITFAPGLAGQTIALTTADGGELAISQGVTILGLGADQLAVSGGSTSRVFDVSAGVSAVVTGLTIENGLTTNTLGGGAVFNAGTLTLTADAVINSTARGGGGMVNQGGGGGGAGLGGGVFNSGTLTLQSSTLSGNQAVGGNGADGSTTGLVGGSGGGPNGGAASTGGGYASGGGGGNYQPGTAGGKGGFGGGGGGGGDPSSPAGGAGGLGGGAGGAGPAGAYGGGGGGGGAGLGGALFNAIGGAVTITNSTLSGNSADGGNGGGHFRYGNALGGNGGSGFGAAVFSNGGTVTITSSTVAANAASGGTGLSAGSGRAGGVYVNAGAARIDSTIVAQNTADVSRGPDVSGVFTDSGHNLIGNTAGSTCFSPLTITGVNPLLNPLGNYGGATQTMSLNSGSLALNTGDRVNGVTVDQRGAQRGPAGLNAGSAPDIGAWEATSSYVVTTDLSDSSVVGTLRGGVEWANGNFNSLLLNAAPNVVRFDTPGVFAAPQTINLGIAGDNTAGPSALGIMGNVEIDGPAAFGQGVTIARDGTVAKLRLFYVAVGGSLTLNDLTLSGGVARGGDGGSGRGGGGGGAGLGGAVFNRGSLMLLSSTLTGNQAVGGNGAKYNNTQAGGGGGGGLGGNGGNGVPYGAGGNGGGPNGGAGGRYAGTTGAPGGNGGGGGGGGSGFGYGGAGGFGGGGGSTGTFGGPGQYGGAGGFGGGGGGTNYATNGGFGGGDGTGYIKSGGGGAGLGGAVFNDAGAVTLTNSTLTTNAATGGTGGFRPGGGNNGSGFGGAVFTRNGTVTITNATIANNTANQGGGGVFAVGDGGTAVVQMVNTIVADTPNAASDFKTATINAGAVSTGGNNNLVQTNPNANGFTGALTITGANPLLGPLANNGGPTKTLGLLAGSPAVNAGDNTAVTGSPSTDQRGQARIRGGAVDLGAVESQISVTAPASPQPGMEGSTTNAFALGSFASFSSGVNSWNVTVNWGDNSAADAFTVAAQGSMGTRAHTFTEEGLYTVTVSVSNSQGDSGQTTFQVNVADAALTAGMLTPPSPIAGAPVTNAVLFHFTDADPAGAATDYTATVTWGDGLVETSAANAADVQVAAHSGGGFDVVGSHTYATAAKGLTFSVSVADAGAVPVSASATLNVTIAQMRDTVVLHTDGSLTEFDPSGVSHPLSPAGTILTASAALDGSGATVVYALTTGLEGPQYQNTLWKFANGAWSEMSSGFFKQISAASNSTGQAVVFSVIGQGDAANALFEQSNAFGPVGLNTGWRLLSPAGTIQSLSAVTDGAGNDVVYAITTSGHNLWEHSPAFPGNGWQQLSTGSFTQVSAGLNAAGQAVAYSVLTNGQLWEQNPIFGPTGVNTQFRQLSGMNSLPPSFLSVTAGGPDVAFGIAADHTVWEHSPAGDVQLSSMLLANQLSAAQTQQGVDELFMTLTDGSFWEYSTAFPKNNPFKELFTSGAASSSTPE
jgi:hypothetical protein